MDDPNITMEEYIQLMAGKAQGRDQTINWETATYRKVYCEDLDSFTDFETDFPAIIYNYASTSNQNVSSEPTVSIYNAIKSDIGFHISFSDSEDEDYTFIYNKDSSSYKLILANDLKPEPVNDYVEINIESCSENIDVKPMDSVICISKDTTPVEFDENFETNHDIHLLAERQPRIYLSVIESVFPDCLYGGMDKTYPGEPSEEVDNVGGVFINMEILKYWSLETSRRLFNTLFAQTLKMENHPEQNIRGFFPF
ncbi:hypothetical protein Tco_1362764 [Tanacetum coccineum]